ncbi:hypothetical protein BC830DRAFT_385817 [Chytriomyces sp. MP71]|nr:hypothetical protein BC830DRAFT_385817 [Chytriomyces sp. MP71]
MNKDIALFSKLYDIDIGSPAEFPQQSLLVQRILTALRLQGSPKLIPASKALWVSRFLF